MRLLLLRTDLFMWKNSINAMYVCVWVCAGDRVQRERLDEDGDGNENGG